MDARAMAAPAAIPDDEASTAAAAVAKLLVFIVVESVAPTGCSGVEAKVADQDLGIPGFPTRGGASSSLVS